MSSQELKADILGLVAEHDIKPERAIKLLTQVIAELSQNISTKSKYYETLRQAELDIWERSFPTHGIYDSDE